MHNTRFCAHETHTRTVRSVGYPGTDTPSTTSASKRRLPGQRRGGRFAWLALPLLASLALSACGTTGPQAAATVTATATPTPAVLVTVSATEQGTLASDEARLVAHVSITNQTNRPIAVTDLGCTYATIELVLSDVSGTVVWRNYFPDSHCPIVLVGPRDVLSIAAGSTIVHSESDLLRYHVRPLQAGQTYTLVATVPFWHQGTYDAAIHGEALSGKDTSSPPVSITLQ